jgi:DNA polymerase-3 subunit delta
VKLAADQLAQHLQRGLGELYAVYGDDPLLTLEAADAIRAAARASGCTEREVFTVERGFNWQSLTMSGNSLSLFASRRLLEIRIPSGKPGTEGGKTLEAYCAALPPDTVTLVLLPKLDKATQNAKWFKALDAVGTTVPVYPVDYARLPEWIGRRLAAQKQKADRDTLRFLAERVEGNLLAAHQEIQKLGLLYPEGNLSFDQVKNAVCDVARYDVFKLADALLEGDAARAARILDGLRGEGEDPILVLWALSRETRQLAKIQVSVQAGTPATQAMRAAGVWDSRQALVGKALRRLPLPRLQEALKRAADIDRMVKGLLKGDVWDELLQLGLSLAH